MIIDYTNKCHLCHATFTKHRTEYHIHLGRYGYNVCSICVANIKYQIKEQDEKLKESQDAGKE
jgi:hypothetical protein